MINLGKSYEVDHWPDNWTAVTIDGKRSAQFEETLLFVSNSPAFLSTHAGVTHPGSSFRSCIASLRTAWKYSPPRGPKALKEDASPHAQGPYSVFSGIAIS